MSTFAGDRDAVAAAGAATTLEQAMAAETARLLRLALSIVGESGEAEDAVQDTWVLAWRSWDSLRDPAQRSAWLTRICVRRCLRLRRRLVLRGMLPARSAATPVDGLAATPDLAWDRAFSALSPKQRAVVVLHYQRDYTLDQCAAAMGCRPGTARQHLARALAKLRENVDVDD